MAEDRGDTSAPPRGNGRDARRLARVKAAVPWVLVAARAGATVVLAFALAIGALSDRLVLALFLVAFVTDYFDGVVARALDVVTSALRQADSAVDTVFYLALAGATWRLHRDVLGRHVPALAVCLATLGAWYLLDLVRWRAVAGFHAWSAKLFAAALGLWAVMLYGFGVDGPWLVVACVCGAISHLEGIAISLVLRQHAADVPTVLHARRARSLWDGAPAQGLGCAPQLGSLVERRSRQPTEKAPE